jgi:hypothetical protein
MIRLLVLLVSTVAFREQRRVGVATYVRYT